MSLPPPATHFAPSPVRPSTGSSANDVDLDLDNPSRVATPSSPGSTSGESLSGVEDSDAAVNDPHSASTGALLGGSTSGVHQAHHHHQRAGSTGSAMPAASTSHSASATHSGTSARASTSTVSNSGLGSRRRHHHHHHHSLTLGTGQHKMGSSITDSAQSTEDEMYDDEDARADDTEDDRPPRVLYPALATPKAAGSNFWPFGTTADAPPADAGVDDEEGQPLVHRSQSPHAQSAHNIGDNDVNMHGSTANAQSQSQRSPRLAATALTMSRSQSSHNARIRNGSLSDGTGPSSSSHAALDAYRHQLNAPEGANAAFLPHEILLKVLRNVRQTEDLVSALQVCKSWCQCGVELLWNKPLFPHVGPLIKMLLIFTRPARTFPYASFIKRLNFSQLADKMSDALLARLAVCERLERLTLAGCSEISDDAVTNLLRSCKGLVALDLSDCAKITDATVKVAAKICKRLQGLNLSGCRTVTDEGVQAIAKGCPLLRRVKLRNLETLTDDAVISLALSCPLLLEVDLYACSSITDRTLWALFRNSSHLRELSLNNCSQVTGEGFPQRDGKIIYIKGGDDLALQGVKPLNPKFSSSSYATMARKAAGVLSSSWGTHATPLPARMYDHVRYLDLTGVSGMTDAAVDGLVATMPHVRNLVLAKCINLTDESIHSICKLGKHIHFLHLGHVLNVTDKAITTLARSCTRLRYIDLACCPNLTDLSVFELAANLPRLKRIGLVRVANLTDQAIFALGERLTLERIHLSYCEHVSVSAIQFLLSRLGRLNHLSLTGVPAFRRSDLQHFCRPPPKDFNPHQRSTFCVYSGKGVHELRKHLLALQATEANGGMNGTSSLIPQLHAQMHPHQLAQMQLGAGQHPQQHHNQHLPTYPHLFHHPQGHVFVTQMPLQQQDIGEDLDEDDDNEEEEENGDDEAEDYQTVMGNERASRPHNHHHASQRHASHHHQIAHHRQTGTAQSLADAQSSSQGASGSAQIGNMPPYYRANHRVPNTGNWLEPSPPPAGSSHSLHGNANGVVASASVPAAVPTTPGAYYSTTLPSAASQLGQAVQANWQRQPNSNSASPLGPFASAMHAPSHEPLTPIRPPHHSWAIAESSNPRAPRVPFMPSRPYVPAEQSSSAASDRQASHTIDISSSALPITPGQNHRNETFTMPLGGDGLHSAAHRGAGDEARQRSHSVEMDLEPEARSAASDEAHDAALNAGMRPRRDTIMQSTFRPE